MKKKSIYSMAVVLTLTMSFTACGDGSDAADNEIMMLLPETTGSEEMDQVAAQNQQSVSTVEKSENTEPMTAQEYLAQAEAYREKGLIRKQRDTLEKSYRLFGDEAAFEKLQGISVNLEEEDAAVVEMTNLMLQNLELEEYLDESVNLITTAEWMQTMMPKLYEGARNYFLQKDGKNVLYVQAGYESGTPYSKVWYMGDHTKVLRKMGNTLQLLTTETVDGNWQGTFESWTLEGDGGDIYHETGSFGNGVLTGNYTLAMHEGNGASELFALWSNRKGMQYTTYDGSFDEQGRSTLEQPAAKKIASLVENTEYNTCIVYAIDVNDCLFEGLTEGADPATYVFGIEKMGWEVCPAFEAYQVVEDAEKPTQPEKEIAVRVIDGMLQLYQDGMWMELGKVADYIAADPMLIYENNRTTVLGQQAAAGGENGFGYQRVGGTLPKDKLVTKPGTSKPSSTPSQSTTPAPTPNPSPAPEQTPMPTPTPTPPPTPNPNPAPNPPSGGDGSGDTDVEWTPDIL